MKEKNGRERDVYNLVSISALYFLYFLLIIIVF